MSNLNHKASEFDAAIRKVRADYGDVSNVNAVAGDVAFGKKIMNANGTLITGTLSEASTEPQAIISGNEVSSEESDYGITVNPTVTVSQAGVIENDVTGQTVTKYIKTEEKSVTPSEREQTITPTYGKLLSKVTVGACDVPPVIDGMYIPTFNFKKPTLTTSTSGKKIILSSGVLHNNVYSGSPSTAKVYLFRLGATLSELTNFKVVDPNTKQMPSTTIILSAGQSVTSTGAEYSPAGIFSFTSEGRVTFQHTASFYIAPSYGDHAMLLYIGGYYYIPCVDYRYFSHGYTNVGTSTTSSATYMSGGGLTRVAGVSKVSYYKPQTLFANLTDIYFFQDGSSSSYSKVRMSFNYGTYESFFIEGES